MTTTTTTTDLSLSELMEKELKLVSGESSKQALETSLFFEQHSEVKRKITGFGDLKGRDEGEQQEEEGGPSKKQQKKEDIPMSAGLDVQAAFNIGINTFSRIFGRRLPSSKTTLQSVSEVNLTRVDEMSNEDILKVVVYEKKQELLIRKRLEKKVLDDQESNRFHLDIWTEILSSPEIFTASNLQYMISRRKNELPTFLKILSLLFSKGQLPYIFSLVDDSIVKNSVAFQLGDVILFQGNARQDSVLNFQHFKALNTLDKDALDKDFLISNTYSTNPYADDWNSETPDRVKLMKSELGNTIYNASNRRKALEDSLLYASSVSFQRLFAKDFFKTILSFADTPFESYQQLSSYLQKDHTERLFIDLFNKHTPLGRTISQNVFEDERNVLFGYYIPYEGLRILAWNPFSGRYDNYVITKIPGFQDTLVSILKKRKKQQQQQQQQQKPTSVITSIVEESTPPTTTTQTKPLSGFMTNLLGFGTTTTPPPAPAITLPPTLTNEDIEMKDSMLDDIGVIPEEHKSYSTKQTADDLNKSFRVIVENVKNYWSSTQSSFQSKLSYTFQSAGKYVVSSLGLETFTRLFTDWSGFKSEIEQALEDITSFECKKYSISKEGSIELSTETFTAKISEQNIISVPVYAPKQWIIQNNNVVDNRFMFTRPGFVNEDGIELVDINDLSSIVSVDDPTYIRKGLVVSLLIMTDHDKAFFAPFSICGGDMKTWIELMYVGRLKTEERSNLHPILYNYGLNGWAGTKNIKIIRFGLYFESHSKQNCHTLFTMKYNTNPTFV